MKQSCLFALLLITLLTLTMCEKSPVQVEQQVLLEISNGYYQVSKIGDNEYKCTFGFNYRVKEENCRVCGYSFEWGEYSSTVDWYSCLDLESNKMYKITNMLIVSSAPSEAPAVTMQAYRQDSSEADPLLKFNSQLREQ